MRRRKENKNPYYVPATELASLGYCETKMVLKHRVGDRVTATQQDARDEGNAAHARFDRVARASHNAPAADKRCFVATCVYGRDDPRTQALREWRDTTLLAHATGVVLVNIYYIVAPWVVACVVYLPATRPILRWLVDATYRHICESHHD